MSASGCILKRSQKPDDIPKQEIDQQESSADRRLVLDGTLTNLDEMVTGLNMKTLYATRTVQRTVKVAVFDNGFAGLEYSLGRRLPADIKIQPYPKNKPQDTPHGTKIAEIVYALASGRNSLTASEPTTASLPLQMFLFNTNGFSNLVSAIDGAIAEGVHYIVYAQVWEYGGNLDGKGFINAEFQRAIAHGIHIISAVGNYGQSCYQDQLKFDSQRYVEFLGEDGKKTTLLPLTVSVPASEVKISLAWNDFRESIDYRTSQDLDLELLGQDHRVLQSQALIQDGDPVQAKNPKYSAHAREIMGVTLEPGKYFLRARAKSVSPFKPNSRFWITANGYGVKILTKKNSNSVMIPADHPNVISVGASDVDFTSVAKIEWGAPYAKPDVLVKSQVRFDNGDVFDGSSSATAIATGLIIAADLSVDFDSRKNGPSSAWTHSELVALLEGRLSLKPLVGIPVLGVSR